MKNNNEDLDIEKLFTELKMDNLSSDFDTIFIKIEKKNTLIKYAKITALSLLFITIGIIAYKSIQNTKNQYKSKNSVKVIDSLPRIQNSPNTQKLLWKNKNSSNIPKTENNRVITDTLTTPMHKDPSDNKVKLLEEQTLKNIEQEPINTEHTKDLKAPEISDAINKELSPKNPCENVSITAYCKTTASCNTKNDGELSIITIGGQIPYKYKLNGNFYKDTQIKNLGAGIYNLTVIDYNNCISKPIIVEISEENCVDENELVYSLSKDNDVKIPLHDNDLLKIVDNRGQIVVQSKSNSNQFIFNSTNVNGYTLKEGLYVLFISRVSGKTLKFDITVLP